MPARIDLVLVVNNISRSVDRFEGVGRFFGTINALPEKNGRNNGGIGFYRAEAGALGDPSSFPDVRGCEGIRLELRSEGWDYSGFLFGFGSTKPRKATGRFSRARGYRAELHMPPHKGDEYVSVDLPFASFTSEWDAGSGEEIAACQDDPHDEESSNCPDDKTKVGFSSRAFRISLESRADISVIIANGTQGRPSPNHDICKRKDWHIRS